MAETTVTPAATSEPVVVIDGAAYMRNPAGQLVPLKAGDQLLDGQILVTDERGYAKLQLPNGDIFEIGPNRELRFDTELASMPPVDRSESSFASAQTVSDQLLGALPPGIDLSTALDPTAAGLAAGAGADEGHGFVRLSRIVEGIDPLAFAFDSFGASEPNVLPQGDANVILAAEPPVEAPTIVTPDSATVPEDSSATGNVLSNDSDADSVLTVASFMIEGNSHLAGETVILPGVGTLILEENGDYSFTPEPNWNGSVPQLTYTTNTGSSTTLDITVTPVNDNPDAVNDGPEALNDALTTAEDTALTIAPSVLLANDTDPENDPLTITSVQDPTHGTVALVDGDVVFTPDPDYNGPASFTYTISDGQGGSDTATVNITVTPVNDNPDAVNDGPEALNDALTTAEDTALTIAPSVLLANDTDPENDPLTITSVQDPTHGTVALVDGDVVFTPDPDYNGPASFTYTISDGQGGSDTATVNITVTPVNDNPDAVNDGPEALNDALTTAEDTALTIAPSVLLANDSDPENDPLTITSVQDPTHGTVALVDGDVVFTPDPDYNGPASFTYTISDGQGGSDTATVNITVTPVNDNPDAVNDGPEALNDALTTAEDTALTIAPSVLLANDSDPENDPLTITSVQDPTHGTVALVNGEVVFTPAADYNGPASFTYTISDGQGGSDTATVNITVTPVNDPPTTDDKSVSGSEDGDPIAITLTGADIDGTVDHFTITSLPANGTLSYNGSSVTEGQDIPATSNSASLSFTPNANWNGDTSFQYAATDNQSLADATPATVNITVDAVNDPPTTDDKSVSGSEDGDPIAITLTGADIDGTVDHFTITSLPANGTLSYNGSSVTEGQDIPATSNSASLSFTPNANWNGDTSFQYAATDNQSLADATPATVNITVDAVNDPPTTDDKSVSGSEDGDPIAITLTGADIDGTVDHFTITSLPANGTLSYNGSSVTEGQDIPATSNSASLSFTPNANWNGDTSFQYAATDNQSLADATPATVNITVDAVNDPPTTDDKSVSGSEDGDPIAITLTGADIDGTVDHFTITSLPANGTLSYNGSSVTEGQDIPATSNSASLSFTPNANWNGDTSFQYAATDNQSLADATPATVNITVDAVNDPPTTDDKSVSGSEDGDPIAITLTGADIDGTVDHFTITSLPANGTLSYNGSSVTEGQDIPATSNSASLSFTPNANWNGDTSFQYAATDNQSLADATPATVNITVDAVNDPPTTDDKSVSGSEDGDPIAITLTGADIDGTVDHFTITSLPANGTLSYNGSSVTEGQDIPATSNSASLSFTPNANWNGDTSFQYAATDNQSLADATPATVNITVDAVNDPPTTDDKSVSGSEDGDPIAITLTGADIDGTVDHFTITSLPANGTLSYNGSSVTEGQDIPATSNSASLSFTPNANWNGDTSFQYAATDNQSLADATPATVSIAVTPVNDLPVAVADSFSTLEDTAFNGSLASNDTPSGDGGNVWSKASDPLHGTVTVNDNGTFTYTPDANYHGGDSFTYTITDADNDTSTTTVTMEVTSVVDDPIFVVGSASGDDANSTDPFTVPPDNTSGAIDGGAGDDLLVGDPGGSVLHPGDSANIVLVLDTSGSMSTEISGISRLEAMQSAVKSALDSLFNSGASDVQICIVDFNTNGSLVGSYTLTENGIDNQMALDDAKAAVDALTDNGYTNYEGGLQTALSWINGAAPIDNATINKVVFISDGEPNRALNNSNAVITVSATDAMANILGTYNPPGTSNDDHTSEVGNIISSGYTIDAVGISVGTTALNLLSQVEGVTGDGADNVTTASQLSTVIGNLAGGSTIQAAAGNDVINGGDDGNDIIFGDALNTDTLAASHGLAATYPAGSGWAIFQALESGQGTDNNGWDRADTIAYIQAHHAELAVESGRTGGNDVINAGIGDDIIYGQEGNDIIAGGAGSDLISGGTGSDTFVWRFADHGTVGSPDLDTIKDFSNALPSAGGDILDLRELLPNAAEGDLTSYLHFEKVGTDTVLHVSSTGAYGSGGFDAAKDDLSITMQNVDLTLAGTDQAIIQDMLSKGKLQTD